MFSNISSCFQSNLFSNSRFFKLIFKSFSNLYFRYFDSISLYSSHRDYFVCFWDPRTYLTIKGQAYLTPRLGVVLAHCATPTLLKTFGLQKNNELCKVTSQYSLGHSSLEKRRAKSTGIENADSNKTTSAIRSNGPIYISLRNSSNKILVSYNILNF